MDRRHFMRLAAAAGAAFAADTSKAAPSAAEAAKRQHEEAMSRYADLTGGPHLNIGMLVYPGMFLQDLVGPLTMFEALMNRDIHLLWKNLEPLGQPGPGNLIPVKPTTTFAQCPQKLDVLFVPGGVPGTFAMMEDREVLDFLTTKGATAGYVTSVCTGSLILGAAGLLDGYKATSHWATLDVLKELGAIPTRQRIVEDRNRITGGGVTAGLDFGLLLAARLRGQTYAEAVQLYLEYDPAPPFRAGSPETASPLARQFLDEMFVGMRETAFATARRARGLKDGPRVR
jgi:cyclohexyl-isocyanide hydratase